MIRKFRNSALFAMLAGIVVCIAGSATYSVSLSFAALYECAHMVQGTTVPNTSGQPEIIDKRTGTVISANFFNSGAIDSPYFDGMEYVSVCINRPNSSGQVTADIEYDVGRDDDATIKGYPQFVFGTKFGNQFETSFRYYDNNGLPPEHQWPVFSSNLSRSGYPFEFANLEYISRVKGLGLPAFTSNLPEIVVQLDLEEFNVAGAERDVMLESWFYDTSANEDAIGDDLNGNPIAGTLNNIVGVGHPHYDELDNLLLEMMVHLGPLSPNDVSGATRNPGKYQLTENYSGRDHDGDGIDDHFDVDSHANKGTTRHPNPGIYSSGTDVNGDGIDDADVLPVTIGGFQYSIWYGTTRLTPLVIFSRETNSSLTHDFASNEPEMDLSREGQIILDWTEFLDFTLHSMEPMLMAANVEWVQGDASPFPKMRSAGGAIGGLEIGVEPQTNDHSDQAYRLRFNELSVTVDGVDVGLLAVPKPDEVDVFVSPLGIADDAQSAFVWQAVEHADKYKVFVSDSVQGEPGYISNWISAADLGCSGGLTNCTYLSDIGFTGERRWRVRAANSVGRSDWSARADFEVAYLEPPDAVTHLRVPEGATTSVSPDLEWAAVPTAEWYRVYVADAVTGAANLLSGWITAADLGCEDDGVCTFQEVPVLSASHKWRVKAANQAGQSDWSERAVFEITQLPGQPANPISPVGMQNVSPVALVWSAVDYATEYRVLLSDTDTGEQQIYTPWLSASSLYCDSSVECRYVLPEGVAGSKKWRVQARNDYGRTEWSTRANFVVAAPAPPEVVLDLEYPIGVLNQSPATLRWHSVADADLYRVLLVDVDTGFQDVYSAWISSADLGCQQQGVCEFALPYGISGKKKWRVKARNTAGNSGWSDKQEFEYLPGD